MVLRAANKWSANRPFVRRSASAGTPYLRDTEDIVSLFGSTKCSTSGASSSNEVFDFSAGASSVLCVEYGGGSSEVCSVGGEYAGGSRSPCGSGDGTTDT